jgi:hypothetical protein
VRALKTITFVYQQREDRILAAINAGIAEAWSCWLTRRIALAVLERTTEFVASTSTLAKRAPSELRGEFVAFERDAAIASTAKAMSRTPTEVLQSIVSAAELADRVTISIQGEGFRLELCAQDNSGAAALLQRAELQRILQMLQIEVAKAGWLAAPARSQAAPTPDATAAKPSRH